MREKETETRKGNVSTTGERNVKERKAGDKKERCKRRQNEKIKCGILLLLICFLVVAVKNPAFAETETGNIEICIEDTGEQLREKVLHSSIPKWHLLLMVLTRWGKDMKIKAWISMR